MDNLDYLVNQEDYVRIFKMKSNSGKIRTIITYADNEKGNALRKAHNDIENALKNLPSYKYSYAYKKGKSTKKALENHFGSNMFIKLDIHNFFESITKDNFLRHCSKLLDNEHLTIDFTPAFYNNHLILGFTTSPRISDLYLYNFDMMIDKYLLSHKGIKYSRYSDDILISNKDNNLQKLRNFASFIEEALDKYDLKINEDKTKEFNLNKVTSASYLGLNLSYKRRKPRITLSKKYILKAIDLYKDCEKIIRQSDNLKNQKNELILAQKRSENKLPQEEFIKKIREYNDKILSKKYQFVYVFNNAKSMVSYIKYNSKDTYKKFMKKYKNIFKRKYSYVEIDFNYYERKGN